MDIIKTVANLGNLRDFLPLMDKEKSEHLMFFRRLVLTWNRCALSILQLNRLTELALTGMSVWRRHRRKKPQLPVILYLDHPKIECLPPTYDSAIHHLRRAYLQTTIWCATDAEGPHDLNTVNFGWEK